MHPSSREHHGLCLIVLLLAVQMDRPCGRTWGLIGGHVVVGVQLLQKSEAFPGRFLWANCVDFVWVEHVVLEDEQHVEHNGHQAKAELHGIAGERAPVI